MSPNKIVCIPIFKPNNWPIDAIIKGKIAPPIIPVKSIPVNIEWFFETEFKPREIMTDHTPEIENPKSLNERTEKFALPWIAKRINKADERE